MQCWTLPLKIPTLIALLPSGEPFCVDGMCQATMTSRPSMLLPLLLLLLLMLLLSCLVFCCIVFGTRNQLIMWLNQHQLASSCVRKFP